MLNDRDKHILERIVRYCDETGQTVAMFGDTLDALRSNVVYKNAVSMCVLQIGELTTHFSKEFLAANTQVPWASIKKMRNIAAHHYGKFSVEILHGTVTESIPKIKEYCQTLLAAG